MGVRKCEHRCPGDQRHQKPSPLPVVDVTGSCELPESTCHGNWELNSGSLLKQYALEHLLLVCLFVSEFPSTVNCVPGRGVQVLISLNLLKFVQTSGPFGLTEVPFITRLTETCSFLLQVPGSSAGPISFYFVRTSQE